MSTAPELFHDYVRRAAFSGDLDKMVAQYADDAVVMPPNDSTLYGLAEIRDWWEEYIRYFNVTSSVEHEREMTVVGDQLFDRRSVAVTIVPKQSATRIVDDVRSLTVWKRRGDDWKITHQIWNSTKPVGAGTNRYLTRVLQKKQNQRPS